MSSHKAERPPVRFRPALTLFCSHSPCKYLLLFIFMVCRGPFEVLSRIHRSVPWTRAAPNETQRPWYCSLSGNPQAWPSGEIPSSCPSSGAGHLRRPVVGEAVLSLSVDWRKDRFAVDLQSSPQGLPDLLCVCNDIPKVPDGWMDGPRGSQQPFLAACSRA